MQMLSGNWFLLLVATCVLLLAAPARARAYLILAASFVFYAFSGITALGLLVGLTVVDFLLYRKMLKMEPGSGRAAIAGVAITLNVAYLIGFKYLVAFAGMLVAGPNAAPDWIRTWVAPLGISFVVVQMIGALIDAWRGTGEEIRSLREFFQFVFLFPQMTIGPIGRTTQLVPQLREPPAATADDLTEGFTRIALGAFKKLAVADRIGPYIDAVYAGNGMHFGTAPAVLAMLLYPIQIYADFSGYSDIAIGSARVLGIRLLENFNQPFLATSITDFWRRWHISFSTWLRDYLYTLLFIQLRAWGKAAMVISLVTTFVICGYWHGAATTFGVFGLLHGIALSVESLLAKKRKKWGAQMPGWLVQVLGMTYVYLFYASSMVFFRSSSVSAALEYLRKAVTWDRWVVPNEIFAYRGPFLFGLLLTAVVLLFACEWSALRRWTSRRTWVFALGLVVVLLVLGNTGAGFIYAQF